MEQIENPKSIELNENSINHLNETRKWTLFFSILGFVGMGIGLIVFPILLLTSKSQKDSEVFMLSIGPIILFTVLYFFPILYLYRFSSNSRKALINSDTALLEDALNYLKRHFRFIGAITIIILFIYFIIGLVMLITTIITKTL